MINKCNYSYTYTCIDSKKVYIYSFPYNTSKYTLILNSMLAPHCKKVGTEARKDVESSGMFKNIPQVNKSGSYVIIS